MRPGRRSRRSGAQSYAGGRVRSPSAVYGRAVSHGNGDMPSFGVRTYELRGTAIVELTGELDLATAPEFNDEVMAALAGPRSVVVDASDLTFVDSSGLSVLFHAHRRSRGVQQMHVVCVPGPVTRVFDTVRAGSLLCLHASLDEAIACSEG